MTWNKIIAFMLAVIAAVDIFFISSIIKMNREKNYFSNATVNDIVTVLQKDGIAIDPETIPVQKKDMYVYKCDIGENYTEDIAEKISASAVSRRYSTPGGVVITLENGDRCEFTDTTELYYKKSGYDNVKLPDESSFNNTIEGLSEKKYSSIVSGFINTVNNGKLSAYPADINVQAAYFNEDDGLYYLLCSQIIDNTDMFTHGFVCALDMETIVSLKGDIVFAPVSERIYSQLTDQINILIIVKKYIDTQRVGSSDSTYEYFVSPTISSLTACYCVYIGSDEEAVDSLYFIPGWKIYYSNNTFHIFNAADGAVYTK